MVTQEVEIEGNKYKITGYKKVGNKFYITVNYNDHKKDVVISFASLENIEDKAQVPFLVWINNKRHELQLIKTKGGIRFELDRRAYEPKFLGTYAPKIPKIRTREIPYEGIKPKLPYKKPTEEGEVIAPMVGRIISVKVKKGDKVTLGQPLCILEAMKMENEITAPKAGIIEEVTVQKGASVEQGKLLVKIK